MTFATSPSIFLGLLCSAIAQQWQNSGFPDVTSVGFVAITGEGDATAAFSDNTKGQSNYTEDV